MSPLRLFSKDGLSKGLGSYPKGNIIKVLGSVAADPSEDFSCCCKKKEPPFGCASPCSYYWEHLGFMDLDGGYIDAKCYFDSYSVNSTLPFGAIIPQDWRKEGNNQYSVSANNIGAVYPPTQYGGYKIHNAASFYFIHYAMGYAPDLYELLVSLVDPRRALFFDRDDVLLSYWTYISIYAYPTCERMLYTTPYPWEIIVQLRQSVEIADFSFNDEKSSPISLYETDMLTDPVQIQGKLIPDPERKLYCINDLRIGDPSIHLTEPIPIQIDANGATINKTRANFNILSKRDLGTSGWQVPKKYPFDDEVSVTLLKKSSCYEEDGCVELCEIPPKITLKLAGDYSKIPDFYKEDIESLRSIFEPNDGFILLKLYDDYFNTTRYEGSISGKVNFHLSWACGLSRTDTSLGRNMSMRLSIKGSGNYSRASAYNGTILDIPDSYRVIFDSKSKMGWCRVPENPPATSLSIECRNEVGAKTYTIPFIASIYLE